MSPPRNTSPVPTTLHQFPIGRFSDVVFDRQTDKHTDTQTDTLTHEQTQAKQWLLCTAKLATK